MELDIYYSLLNFSITSSKLLQWSFISTIVVMSCISKLFIVYNILRLLILYSHACSGTGGLILANLPPALLALTL